ncbi:MAG: hypothetical protein ACE15C_10395 [Phycisphaerae bacterium]
MKRLALLLAVVAVGVWAFSCALAADGAGDTPKPKTEGGQSKEGVKDAPKGEPKADAPRKEGERKEGERKDGEKPGLKGDMARMADACGLTDEQQKRIAELNAAQQKEIQDIIAKYQAQIMDVLTADQKAKWNTAVLMQGMEKMTKRFNLTDDQLTKIKAAIPGLTKDMVPTDEKSRGEAFRKLQEYIFKDVLTDEQRATGRDGPREGAKEGAKEGVKEPVKEGPKDAPKVEKKEVEKKVEKTDAERKSNW